MRGARTADKIVQYCAIILIALLPIFFIPLSWVTVAQAKTLLLTLLVFVAVVVWSIGRFIDRAVRIPRSFLFPAALALPIAYTLSAIISGASFSSFAGGGEGDTVAAMWLFFGLLALVALASEDVYQWTILCTRVLIAGALALIVFQLLHVLVPALSLGVFSGTATTAFGGLHELAIVAGLYVFLSALLSDSVIAEGWWKWPLLTLGILSAIVLLLANFSDVWYVLAAALLLSGAHEWYVQRSKGFSGMPYTMLTRIGMGVAALILGFSGAFIAARLPAGLQNLQQEVRPSWQGTFAIGKSAYATPRQALFGTGPGSFTRDWNLYKPAGVNTTIFWNVDFTAGVGFIPTAFITVGAVGLLAWVALVLALLFSTVRFLHSSRRTLLRNVSFALIGSALYLTVFHIVYVPGIALSALTFLIIGLVALGESEISARTVMLRPYDARSAVTLGALAIVVAGIILASLMLTRAVASDILVNKSAYAYSVTGNTQQSLSLIGAALLVNAGNDRAERAAVELGLLELQDLLARSAASSTTALLRETLQMTIQHGLAAVSANSGDYQNWLSLAVLYQNLAGAGVEGAYQNAKSAFEKAYAESPQNPLPLLQLSQLDIAQGNFSGALTLLNQAITLKPDFAAAYLLRSQVEMQEKNFPLAAQDAVQATLIAPSDPLGFYNLGVLFYVQQSYDQAAQALEKAVRLQNDYADALFVLGLSYDKLGRHKEALAVLERVVALNPNNATVMQAIRNIKAGKPALPPQTSAPKR